LKDLNVDFFTFTWIIPQFNDRQGYGKKNNLEYVFTPHGAINTVALERSKWKKKA